MTSKCAIGGCNKPILAKGMCRSHYLRNYRYGSPTAGAPFREHRNQGRKCRIEGCSKVEDTKRLCTLHYARLLIHGNPIGGGTYHGELSDFMEIAKKVDGEDCILWPYTKNSSGYGMIRRRGQPRLVHREILQETKGPPPSRKHYARHLCGNGSAGCINPRHLAWGTPKENARDKIGHGTHLRGTQCAGAKLSESQVISIFENKSRKTTRQLAEENGVSTTTIDSVRSGRNWGWLTKKPSGDPK